MNEEIKKRIPYIFFLAIPLLVFLITKNKINGKLGVILAIICMSLPRIIFLVKTIKKEHKK